MKLLHAILIVTTAALANGQSGCGVCSSVSKAACVGENTFQICEGDPLTPVTTKTHTCPGTKKCSDSAAICSNNVAPGCISQCGRCSSDNRFACVDDKTFAFCFGEKTPSDVTQRCADGLVCSIEQSDYCVDSTENSPSCALGERPPPTTPSTPGNPLERCKAKSYAGRYPVEEDEKCQQYLYCFYRGGQIQGQIYRCPRDTIFDGQQRTCVPAETNTCRRY